MAKIVFFLLFCVFSFLLHFSHSEEAEDVNEGGYFLLVSFRAKQVASLVEKKNRENFVHFLSVSIDSPGYHIDHIDIVPDTEKDPNYVVITARLLLENSVVRFHLYNEIQRIQDNLNNEGVFNTFRSYLVDASIVKHPGDISFLHLSYGVEVSKMIEESKRQSRRLGENYEMESSTFPLPTYYSASFNKSLSDSINPPVLKASNCTASFCMHLKWHSSLNDVLWLKRVETLQKIESNAFQFHNQSKVPFIQKSDVGSSIKDTVWTIIPSSGSSHSLDVSLELQFQDFSDKTVKFNLFANQIHGEHVTSRIYMNDESSIIELSYKNQILNNREFMMHIGLANKSNINSGELKIYETCKKCHSIDVDCQSNPTCKLMSACFDRGSISRDSLSELFEMGIGSQIDLYNAAQYCIKNEVAQNAHDKWKSIDLFNKKLLCTIKQTCLIGSMLDNTVVPKYLPGVQKILIKKDIRVVNQFVVINYDNTTCDETLWIPSFENGGGKGYNMAVLAQQLSSHIKKCMRYIPEVHVTNTFTKEGDLELEVHLDNFVGQLPTFELLSKKYRINVSTIHPIELFYEINKK